MRARSLVPSGAVAAGLAVAGVALAATHAVPNGHYIGKTTQRQPVTIVVAGNGRKIASLKAAVSYDGLCGHGGGGPAFAISASNVPIVANGSFSATTLGKLNGAASLHMIVTGTFTGKTVNGTIAELHGHCAPPKQVVNPYLTRFSAKPG